MPNTDRLAAHLIDDRGQFMSGPGNFAGTTYQSGVIAFVSVHVLLEARLNWIELEVDRPTAIAAEAGGPGDDAEIEFSGAFRIQVQAKHGLSGAAALRENVRAQLRVIVKRILRKHGYPPDKQEKATQTVLEQAELLSEIWTT